MRRPFAALLLLAACITEETRSTSPSIWYSIPTLPDPPRVGVVDRERIVEAYYESSLFHEYAAALTRERERAEASGAGRDAAILRMQEKNLITLRDRQLDGEGGVANIILMLERLLPDVALTHGIDIIVEEGTWSGEAKNVIDVTDDLIAKLPPAAEG